MKRCLVDPKQQFAYAVFQQLNKIAVQLHFKHVEVIGREHIPADTPFLLVANHISRWDGLILQQVIDRPTNWMVSPNELRGLQGLVLRSMGAFPASPCYNLLDFAVSCAAKGQGIVIFPEGNTFGDGTTHPFKNGAARLALHCVSAGLPLKVVPAALSYAGQKIARVIVSQAVDMDFYLKQYAQQCNMGIRSFSVRLHREVCYLRWILKESGDSDLLFTGRPLKSWVPRTDKVALGRSQNSTFTLATKDLKKDGETMGKLATCFVEASHGSS
ncbi:MAG: 1-acyl-sn-glycerol-3-phosphate acyltransferase [Candidatus Melainabacteria bacterium]|nr:1-acyl-sn-glycerol-3-phosphate acyltransferase [Candidatus Melainabacteria bacterium]